MEKTKTNNLEQVRVAIQREFLGRCRKNPAYSLRAFAKYLNIDQSFLSKILKGQRAVTADLAQALVPKLGLKSQQIEALFQSGAAQMPGFLPLSDDEFEFLSQWHHFAILELIKTEGFDPNPSSISHRLGVHVEETRAALRRLEQLKFIRITSSGIKLVTPNHTATNTQRTSEARRKLQRELMEKSLYALDHVPFESREHGSLTVAINPKRLPEFKEKLKQVRKELADFFQQDGEENLSEVYQLTLSFYPLTNNSNKK